MKKIHLGCGIYPLNGWINIDIIGYPNVTKCDLRNPLPFENNSIDYFFSEHFFEHLTKKEGSLLLKEIYRCLKPKGVSRITVPDLSFLIKCYNKNDLEAYVKVGFKPKTKCELINDGMKKWGHKYMYDIEELLFLHKVVGFSSYYQVKHKQSSYRELNNLERRIYTEEISCEAIK